MKPILLFKKQYNVVGIIENDRMVLRDGMGIDKAWEIETLLGHYLTGNLKPVDDQHSTKPQAPPVRIATRLVSDVSEDAKREAQVRKQYLDAIEHSGAPIRAGNGRLTQVLSAVTTQLYRKRAPSISTIKRWRALKRTKGDDAAALIPYFERRGGSGKDRLSPVVVRAIETVIDDSYMTEERFSAQRAYDGLCASLHERNQWTPTEAMERIPSYSTFLRRLKRRAGYELVAARQGAKQAELNYRSSNKSKEIFGFNECWEIDHTTIDLFVIDTQTGLSLGRPRFTAAIEYTTRALMGFDLEFSGASAQATLNCLKHAMLPKTYLRERYPEVQGDWPCFGLPQILKCDNGSEFHSKSVKDACFELGIELQYCPVKQPWYKGRIERFFRTFNDSALAGLPGATGSHYYNRPEGSDPATLASIDLQNLLTYLHIWIVDVYMPSSKRGAQ